MATDRVSSALLALGLTALVPASSDARVVRLIVERTRVVADGASFGAAGPYERLDGTAFFEVDPREPVNAGIVNLENAPRNARGMVEFSSPFFILKPVDITRGNRKIFYGVNNRGGKLDYSWRTFLAPGTNNNSPLTAQDLGDGLLLRLGYTYVDAGWQGNVAPGNDRLVPTLPVAVAPEGRPIVARIRVEYSDVSGFTVPLEGSDAFRAYETADRDTARATLTVRQTVQGPKTPIPPDRWTFGRCTEGKASLVSTTTDLCLFEGFDPDRLYELVYPAKNPLVMGLGYAVTRDLASFLRYQARDEADHANPLAVGNEIGVRRAYGSGISSTGMYMRDFLYLGFNEDEGHRKVFDAIQIVVPGTHRLLANVEFSDPNAYSRQDLWHDFVSYSYPPLTFAVTTDPISGLTDGILKRPATDPLVFQVESSSEFWQMNASLNVHDALGRPVPIPDNVRLYFASGFQHGGTSASLWPGGGPTGLCQYETQRTRWPATLRALLVNLDAWADAGVEPPKSNYPRLEDETLVPIETARALFPSIPGVKFPSVMNELSLPRFGPGFAPAGGRLSHLPPDMIGRYQLYVPRPDADGLDVGGIRPIEVAVPTGTMTGWNLRAPGHREGNLCANLGTFIPFARTKAARQAAGDPRPSFEERYGDQAGFAKAIEKEASRLVKERFLLQEDADRYIASARNGNQ